MLADLEGNKSCLLHRSTPRLPGEPGRPPLSPACARYAAGCRRPPGRGNLGVPSTAWVNVSNGCFTEGSRSIGNTPSAGFEVAAGHDGEVVVRAAGEIDLATAPEFRERLSALTSVNGHDVMVDLADVSFIDSTGLVALVQARQSLESCGRQLIIVRPSPAVTRVLEIAGLDRLFGEQD